MNKSQYIERHINRMFAHWLVQVSVWGAIIFMALSLLDFVSAPAHFRQFLLYRIVIALTLLAVSCLASRIPAERTGMRTALALGAIAAAAATIELMILKLGGHASSYYAGMIVLGICVMGFIPAGMTFHAVSALMIYGIYLVPILLFDTITDPRAFFTDNAFLVASLASTLFLRHLAGIDLRRALDLQFDLEQQQELLGVQVSERTAQLKQSVRDLEQEVRERERAEQELAESEEKYRLVVENAGEGILVAQGGRIAFVNPALTTMTGYAREELTDKPFIDFIHTDDRSLVMEQHLKRLKGELPPAFSYGFRIVTRAGAIRWVEVRGTLSQWQGTPATVNFLVDITEHRAAEEALQKSTDRLFAILQASPAAVIALDREGTVTTWNDAAARIFGWSEEEAIGRSFPAVSDDRIDEFLNLHSRVIEGESFSGLEVKRRRKDGTLIDVSVSTAPLKDAAGTVTGAMAILADITEHKKAENALKESELKYRDLFENANDLIFIVDLEQRYLDANKKAIDVLGYSKEELLAMRITDIIAPELRRQSEAEFEKLRTRGSYEKFLGRIRTKNGRWLDVEINSSAIVVAGRPVGSRDILRDITDRIRTEKALRDSEEKFRTLFEESRDVFYISTPEGKFLDINPAGVALFGYDSKDELLSIDIGRELYADPEARRAFVDVVDQSSYAKDYEVRMKRKNGQELDVQITSTAVRDSQGRLTAFRGIIRDVTEHKRLEQQLLQSQKMEAVGQLAGGVAHDFNNVLTAVMGYTNLLLMKLPPGDHLRTYVEQIAFSAERASSLTRSLLAFSRKQVITPTPGDLNEIVHSVESLLHRLIGEDIELITRLYRGDLIVVADRPQIEQVLMNLATNARDAMPGGGRLTIETEMRDVDEASASQLRGFSAGTYAVMTVSDTGTGMNAATQVKIFEPFFTTKETGKGTGLGLAMAYGIVKQHEGYITVSSEPGRGTSFTIYLPLIREPRERVVPAAPETQPSTGGTETILLGEDNDTVRLMTKEILGEFGYTVIEAVDGEEAIAKFLDQKDRIDLVILDVIMPKKNGRQVYDAVKTAKPGIKVLFTSGYTADIIRTKGIMEEGLHFIQKPAPTEELLATIRLVLDEQPPG